MVLLNHPFESNGSILWTVSKEQLILISMERFSESPSHRLLMTVYKRIFKYFHQLYKLTKPEKVEPEKNWTWNYFLRFSLSFHFLWNFKDACRHLCVCQQIVSTWVCRNIFQHSIELPRTTRLLLQHFQLWLGHLFLFVQNFLRTPETFQFVPWIVTVRELFFIAHRINRFPSILLLSI